MRHLAGVILATTAILSGCAFDEAAELGDTEQAITGNFTQGNYTQGNYTQGNYTQGSVDAVYGFRTTGWLNSGMKLKNAGVESGHLVAAWDKTAACGPINTSLSRTCDWHTPGSASCIPTTSVTVRAGGCAANPSQRSMIRVCSGSKPCAHAANIASTDAVCSGTTNPAVTFTCPSTGRYFVMVGPKTAGFGTPASSFTYAIQTTPGAIFRTALLGVDFEGTTLDGLLDEAPSVIRYRITAAPEVDTADPSGLSSLYTLHEDNAAAAPMCIGTDNRAMPLVGRWYPDGTFSSATDSFTFGCTIGVVAKCYRHGYRPWASENGTSLRDYHQTCTRAARGDFCGDGGSYTVNGTTIDLYDRLGRVDPEADPPGSTMAIEAVWQREVIATSGSDVRWGNVPRCLAKKRWDTMPYDAAGRCPDLVDPRTSGDDVGFPYCDEVSVSGWWADSPDNLIITESALYDAGLWRWKRASGGDFRSTTACSTTEDVTPCVPDYLRELTPAGREPVLLGAVYHKDLEASLRPANTIPLYSFRNASTGDYLTTTDESWPGYAERELEGYIYDRSCEATTTCPDVRLELWLGNGDYVATTSDEDPGTGYVFWKTLGYLPR